MIFLDWTLVAVIPFLVWYGLRRGSFKPHLAESITTRLSRLKDFDPSCTLISSDGLSGLAIDETRRQVCLIEPIEPRLSPEHPKIGLRNVSYNMILRSEVVEDGTTVAHTSRRDQPGGIALGEAILKSTGEVSGRLSAQDTSLSKSGLALRLIINDTDDPIHRILVLDAEHQTDQVMYKAAYKLTEQWHDRLSDIIHECQEQLPMSKAPDSDHSETKQPQKVLNTIH
jgi:hypothetical protein